MTKSHPFQTIAKLLLRSIDQKDWDVVSSLLHPKTKYEVSGYMPFIGRDAVMKYYQTIRPIESGEHFVESMMIGKDKAVCWGRFFGKNHGGLDVVIMFADIMIFEEKKIVQRRVYNCDIKSPNLAPKVKPPG